MNPMKGRWFGIAIQDKRACECCKDYVQSAKGRYVDKTRTTRWWLCDRCADKEDKEHVDIQG